MKNIFKSILILLALTVGFASCTSEEADLFDKSAAQRLNQSVEKYQKLLESSQYGWVMEFFPSDGSYGGYVYTAKFSEGDVDMACELSFSNSTTGESWPAGTVVSSKYTVKSEQSVILTFDTYNLLFHFFSEPKSASNTTGYESDYEFVFLRASADGDSIYLRGKKYENELVMVKLKEDMSSYIKTVMTYRENISAITYKKLTVNGQTYDVILSGSQFTMTDENGDDLTIPIVYNSNGIRLYEPITIDGKSYQAFKLDETTGNLVSVDGDASLLCPSSNEQFLDTDSPWCFQTSSATADMSTDLLAKFKTALTTRSSSYTFGYAGFVTATTSTDLSYGYDKVLGFYWTLSGLFVSRSNYGISISFDSEDGDIVSIKGLGMGYGYNSYKTKLNPFVNAVCDGSPYKITFNEGYAKKEATLTSVADSNVWFKLYKY